jgi:hypothetical protein
VNISVSRLEETEENTRNIVIEENNTSEMGIKAYNDADTINMGG